MEKISFKMINELIEKESKFSLGLSAKTVYISILFNEYEERIKRGTQNDMSGFIVDVKNEIDKYELILLDLQNAGLIQINGNKIHFYPLWMKYVQPEQLIPFLKTISVFKDDLINGSYSFKEMTCRANKISIQTLDEMILKFVEEQEAMFTTYHDFSGVVRHCGNWVKKRLAESKPGSQTNISNKL